MVFGEEFWGRERREELLREAGERRMARRLRLARRRAVRAEGGGERDARVTVRWGLHADDERVARLLDLNGIPRWVAFEERFVVAERDGMVLGAMAYRTEPKRMMLGLLVVDPWAGERRLAVALYGGIIDLARELGVREIRVASGPTSDYPREAGYRRRGRGWRAVVPPSSLVTGSAKIRLRDLFAVRRAA